MTTIMRNLIILIAFILIATGTINKAEAVDIDVSPLVAAGHRFGNDDLNGDGAFYGSFKLTTMSMEVGDFKQINFLSLGINYQDDKKWAASISPLSLTSLSGMTLGFDYIPKTNNVNGDILGVWIGYKFK
jgi:hypothetical protein